jgi:hypothetical protein
VSRHTHSPGLSSQNEGNFQQIANRNDFLGWGNLGYFSEYGSRGRLLLDGHFVGANSNYRAYKFVWTGTPTDVPAVAASRHRRQDTVYVSWNGATYVRDWRILGGASPTALHPVGKVAKHGFETSATVSAQHYIAVQALDWSGNVMSTSATARAF